MSSFIARRAAVALLFSVAALVFGPATAMENDEIIVFGTRLIDPVDLSMPYIANYSDGVSMFSLPPDGTPAPGADAASDGCNESGNPIIVSSGNKVERETDFTSSGEMPLSLSRTYNRAVGEVGSLFGPRWLSSFDFILKYANHDALLCTFGSSGCVVGAPSHLYAYRPDGRRIFYSSTNSGEYREASWHATSWGALIDPNSPTRIARSGSNFVLYNETGGFEVYDVYGKVLQVGNAHGVTWSYSYGANGRVERITHSSGRSVQFTWTGYKLTAVTDPAGNIYQYGYKEDFNIANYLMLSSAVLPGAPATTITYHYLSDEPGNLYGKSYNGVRYSTFGYDDKNRATLSEHAGGVDRHTFEYTADAAGKIVQTVETNPLGKRTTYTFGPHGLTSVAGHASTYCAASNKSNTYDIYGNLDQVTDFNGNVIDLNYDTSGRLLSRTEAAGTASARTTSYSWDTANNRLFSMTLAGEKETSFTYHSDNRLASVTIRNLSPYGISGETRTTTYTYTKHANNLVATMVMNGPAPGMSDAVTYTYSQQGDLLSVRNSLDHVVTYSNYNGLGYPQHVSGPNPGEATELVYDARGRLIQSTVQGFDASTTYTYHANGLLASVTTPEGVTSAYDYDDARRLTEERRTDASGTVASRYTHDNAGNVRTRTLLQGTSMFHRSFSDFDEIGRERARRGNSGQNIRYTYDTNDNILSITDSLDRTRQLRYDALNRVSMDIDALNRPISFGYDKADRVNSVRDARGLVTQYNYDGFGQLRALSSRDSGTVTRTYDPAGNLQTTTDARGVSVSYVHDGLNRVLQAAFGDRTVTYTYDSGATGKGRLTGTADAMHNMTRTYNARGLVTSETQAVGSVVKSVGYLYTSDRLTTITMPSGHRVVYGYTNDRITSVAVDATPVLRYVRYHPMNVISSWTWFNGTVMSREYDLDGRIIAIASNGESSYTYYPDDRLKTWTEVDAPFGPADTATSLTIDSYSNRIASTVGAVSRVYAHDAIGNVISDGVRSFDYDNAGRLVTVNRGGTTASYTYNAFGLRVKKTVNGLARYFIYDTQGQLLGEYDAAGAMIQEIVWLQNTPVAVIRPNGTSVSIYYIHVDHLNTPRRISRPTGQLTVWRWKVEPFGYNSPNEDPDGDGVAFAFNLRFPGQYFDAETGLYQNWHRYYDPAVGRYLQSDPIGLQGGFNTYTYAGGNPVSLFDATGLDTAVIINGPTEGNPFGHTAIAFTGAGVFSFGNGWPLGGSTRDYLLREAPRRNTVVYTLKTTPEQEQAMQKYLKGLGDKSLQRWPDNCANRTSGALAKGGMPYPGIFSSTSWPVDVLFHAGVYQEALGGSIINIPQGSTILPPSLAEY